MIGKAGIPPDAGIYLFRQLQVLLIDARLGRATAGVNQIGGCQRNRSLGGRSKVGATQLLEFETAARGSRAKGKGKTLMYWSRFNAWLFLGKQGIQAVFTGPKWHKAQQYK
jgi:hypothetical protein